jgi:hypothetical protein
VEKAIKNLVEMSKTVDEIALDLNKVESKLNNLKVALKAKLDEEESVESADPMTFHIR